MRKSSAMHAKKALVVSKRSLLWLFCSSAGDAASLCSSAEQWSEYLLMIFVHKWPVAIFSASIYVYIHFYFSRAKA